MDEPTKSFDTWEEALEALVEGLDDYESELGRILGELQAIKAIRAEIYGTLKKSEWIRGGCSVD